MKLSVQTPESSNIFAIEYDSVTKVLTIDFNQGSRYDYADVPQTVVADFIDADSKGEYFHDNIRGTYSYKKVG